MRLCHRIAEYNQAEPWQAPTDEGVWKPVPFPTATYLEPIPDRLFRCGCALQVVSTLRILHRVTDFHAYSLGRRYSIARVNPSHLELIRALIDARAV
jgi:hypothetical protein